MQLLRSIILFAFYPALTLLAQNCAPDLAPASLRGQRPLEINPNVPPGTCGFLQFAWDDFLSLNWPALPVIPSVSTSRTRGIPDQSKLIGQGGNRVTGVWEQFQPNWYLFWPNNPPPPAATPPAQPSNSFAAWNQNAWLPAACGPLQTNLPAGSAPPRILSSLSKLDAMPGVAQAFSAPLIDQNGYYSRYEIVLDYETFHYINSNQLYLLPKLKDFVQHQPISFPVQSADDTGATFIKAAWKPLFTDAERNSGRYHIAQAFLFTAAGGNVAATCAGPVPMGLVGLHIVHKTQGFPMWLWATFEQVDNTPDDTANPGPTPPQGWAFFKPGSAAPANVAPKCPDGVTPFTRCDFQPTSSHLGQAANDKTGGPVQVVRKNPIAKSANQPGLDEINKTVHDALVAIDPNNVWQYYRLIDAQWQNANANPQAPCTVKTGFFPACNIANATMETYLQTNSCMGCHKGATAPSSPAAMSDLTFELGLAWQPNNAPVPHLTIPTTAKPGNGKAPAK
jgi:hypothetical protein